MPMRSRSRKTIDPSHPNIVWTERVGLPPTRQAVLVAPSATRREVFGESHEKVKLHPTITKNRL